MKRTNKNLGVTYQFIGIEYEIIVQRDSFIYYFNRQYLFDQEFHSYLCRIIYF